VHAGGFRRKGGDSQCVVVLVHKERQDARLECLGMLDGPLRGERGVLWDSCGMLEQWTFGLPLVAAFNRVRLQSVFIRVCPGRSGCFVWYE
jgi:hypothetical protein